MRKPIIDPKKSYNFSDYFALNPPIDELLAYFGYSRHVSSYVWPKAKVDLTFFAGLKQQFETHLCIADSTTFARQRIITAPILLNLGVYLQTRVYIEYHLNVNQQLKGYVDYYLYRNHHLFILENKNDDLGRGFMQLAVELIALDKWLEEDNKPLYGCVSIGNVWQFAMLNRESKVITQDMNSYSVPNDLEELLQILIAMLDN